MAKEGRTKLELAQLVANYMTTPGIMRIDILTDETLGWVASVTSSGGGDTAQKEADIIAEELRNHVFLVDEGKKRRQS